jgi:putative transposase
VTKAVLEQLHGERFADCAPAQVYATLLDEGQYLCSERTMYRLLDRSSAVRRHGAGVPGSVLPGKRWY